MSSIIQYAGINAKVKALIGEMLSEEDYQRLVDLKTVQEVFDYLYKNTNYREYLTELTGREEIHRRPLELTLKKNFINDYEKIYRYLTGSSRQFFKFLFAKFEIEDLKMLLRTILVEHDEDYLEENLLYLGVYTDVSISRLTEINTYQDLLEVFQNTPYYNTLRRFEERYKRDNNLFPVEMTLDFNYFTRLASLSRNLSGDDFRMVRDLLGTQVDLTNIHWIYRIKKFYNLSYEEILNYTLPFYYRLSAEELRAMAQLKEADDIFAFLSRTSYDSLFSRIAEDKSILFEKYFLSYILKRSYQAKIKGTFNIGVIIAYLYIKEYEIRDMITIVEGVRYSLESNIIRKYLIKDWV